MSASESPRSQGLRALEQARQFLYHSVEDDMCLHKAFAAFEKAQLVFRSLLAPDAADGKQNQQQQPQQPRRPPPPEVQQGVRETASEIDAITELFRNNPFLALQIKPTNDRATVKKSYFKLARLYHPDKSSHTKQLFVQVQEAYEILRDERQLQRYFGRLG
jgi:hypothetical protein